MRWTTRAGLHVDRTACAWLIRRFVDGDAEFVFFAASEDMPQNATAFDVPGQPFSHHRGGSTFEVMVDHYEITEPGIERLAQVVHEADIEDERFNAPEAVGLDAIIRGLGKVLPDDYALVDAVMPIYDGLLVQLRSPAPA